MTHLHTVTIICHALYKCSISCQRMRYRTHTLRGRYIYVL